LSLERRRTPRIPFVASAEIIDEAESTRTASQLSDLSLHGCFVRLPNPFPGTPVTIEIYKDEDFIETPVTGGIFSRSAAWDSPLTAWSPNLLPC
jgi:PilZ domain